MSSGSSGDAYADDAFEDEELEMETIDAPLNANAEDGYSDDEDFERDEASTVLLDNPPEVDVPALRGEELQPPCSPCAPPALHAFVVAKLRRLGAKPVDTRLQAPVPVALFARLGRPHHPPSPPVATKKQVEQGTARIPRALVDKLKIQTLLAVMAHETATSPTRHRTPRSLFTYAAYHTSRLHDQAWASHIDALYARRPDPLAIAAAAMSALRPAYAPLNPLTRR
ncbi:hypothetical protein SPRG_07404 [Saprolegnia parasitica CBS 223.65]|uniref:Uncharacterized protein n=1 Tax=Saprolegnia parasitica (strain CBS 223.65) TaxID=695850 RepID=A0A067CF60_SAPPC|nr:hypothetical protein SPRG_07404 [Saprolegnia parasitica CBS 223.65]KDO27805.1 hypothetical protein SPRG_07404 [Saprolegnia parasitica CBS 223.65]|eukprot:XP_012201580.1 hypothetical protein SPRG_07404 [Saprolegnia parasitica CBS 223.65]